MSIWRTSIRFLWSLNQL